jgi:hypothetical protein
MGRPRKTQDYLVHRLADLLRYGQGSERWHGRGIATRSTHITSLNRCVQRSRSFQQ